jgi:hypothetical protein
MPAKQFIQVHHQQIRQRPVKGEGNIGDQFI